MKYKIFVYGLMVIGAISIMGCSGKKKNFSPNEPGRADITKSSVLTDSVESENAVKLTIMVQKPSSDFPQNAAQALESKMLTIASKNGIVGYGGDPAFVFAALITPSGKDVTTTPPVKKVMKRPEGIIIEGIDNCLIKLARCCSPLPGDEIIGFITRGHGVSIHKRDCNNVPRDISKADEPDRWISAHWGAAKREHFLSSIRIHSVDRDGLLSDIMGVAYNMRLAVHSMNARKTTGGNCVISIMINTESVEHLGSIIAQIEKIRGVFGVERVVK